MKNYWLVKSEPEEYSIDDLKRDGKSAWTGVRNYQARNYMRDQMQVGDKVLFYHSSTEKIGVVGRAEVASTPYPDSTAFDPKSPEFDPKSSPSSPTWILVDIAYKEHFPKLVPLSRLREDPNLEGLIVARRGNRLSITPVTEEHFRYICQLATA